MHWRLHVFWQILASTYSGVNVACLIHKMHTMRADKRILESHRGCTSGMLGINNINILLFLAHNTGTLWKAHFILYSITTPVFKGMMLSVCSWSIVGNLAPALKSLRVSQHCSKGYRECVCVCVCVCVYVWRFWPPFLVWRTPRIIISEVGFIRRWRMSNKRDVLK